MPWLSFPSACSRLSGGKERLIGCGHGFPKFLRECVAAGRITACLEKGSWPDSARSPAAAIPGQQTISQRAEALRLGEITRAGAGTEVSI
ncbi:hypothetical protein [Desulfosporosinus sp.]|uniref:hypothetical protein n=1 Tax=Desulfosporosinus sp. TaxID=157907 RepID=UPI0025BF568E|nr:hypothetical protein [Desulfosporosinus sp.]MBC2726952.1 hypothetical protein [Desulfosporosinus sp.]